MAAGPRPGTCSSACRKRVSRRKCDTPQQQNGNGASVALDFETRQWLRGEVDRLRREQIESRNPLQTARDLALFADDPGRVLR